MKSLKKIKFNEKKDSNISRTNNFPKNFQTTFNTENQKFYLLPPLKKTLYKNSLNQQSSVLSNYIENFVSNFINATKSFKNFNSKSNSKMVSKRESFNISSEKKLFIKKDQNELKDNESITNNDIHEEKNKLLCLSDRNDLLNTNTRNQNNFSRKLLYITEIKKKKKDLSPQTSFSESKISSSKNNIKIITPTPKLIIPKGNEKYIPKSIDIKQELSLYDLKKLEKYFRRKKTYQPNILTDWKLKAGIDIKNSKKHYISEVENDVEYQSKVLKDQVKLLEGNIKNFNKNIITDNDFQDAFRCLSLKSKINFNKALEETIGIIFLLPQLILTDFYEVIKKFKSIKIPDNDKFREKYVFDESDNLIYNCNLLTEVSDFFNSCFEVYLILIYEVEEMNINFKNFTNILSAFEKARYNMIYVINSAINAIQFYKKDMNFVNKISAKMGVKKKAIQNKLITNKIMNQFSFKKNPERQKKLMIDSCLSDNNREDDNKQDIIFNRASNKNGKTPKFKSLVNSKLIKNLLKQCNGKTKNIINTEIINNQMNEDFFDDDEIVTNAKRKVIKINF